MCGGRMLRSEDNFRSTLESQGCKQVVGFVWGYFRQLSHLSSPKINLLMMYYEQMFDLCIYFLYLHIQGIVKLSHIKGVAKKRKPVFKWCVLHEVQIGRLTVIPMSEKISSILNQDLKICFHFICMSILRACMCVHAVNTWYPQRPEESHIPWKRSYK